MVRQKDAEESRSGRERRTRACESQAGALRTDAVGNVGNSFALAIYSCNSERNAYSSGKSEAPLPVMLKKALPRGIRELLINRATLRLSPLHPKPSLYGQA